MYDYVQNSMKMTTGNQKRHSFKVRLGMVKSSCVCTFIKLCIIIFIHPGDYSIVF